MLISAPLSTTTSLSSQPMDPTGGKLSSVEPRSTKKLASRSSGKFTIPFPNTQSMVANSTTMPYSRNHIKTDRPSSNLLRKAKSTKKLLIAGKDFMLSGNCLAHSSLIDNQNVILSLGSLEFLSTSGPNTSSVHVLISSVSAAVCFLSITCTHSQNRSNSIIYTEVKVSVIGCKHHGSSYFAMKNPKIHGDT